MKDLLKRILCIALALTMVVALVACGSSEDEDEEEEEETAEEGGKKSDKKSDKKDDEDEEEDEEPAKKEDTLVGEWEGTIDMSDYLNEMMEAELGVDLGVEDFAIVMTIEFDEDGTYKAELNTSKLEGAMGDFVDKLWDAMMEMSAEEYGMTIEEVEEAMEQSGVTKEALMEEVDLEALMEEAFAEFDDEAKGEWVLDGDQLYMASEDPEDTDPVEIEFDGDEFSIVGGNFLGDMDDEMVEAILPIVFERV